MSRRALTQLEMLDRGYTRPQCIECTKQSHPGCSSCINCLRNKSKRRKARAEKAITNGYCVYPKCRATPYESNQKCLNHLIMYRKLKRQWVLRQGARNKKERAKVV